MNYTTLLLLMNIALVFYSLYLYESRRRERIKTRERLASIKYNVLDAQECLKEIERLHTAHTKKLK